MMSVLKKINLNRKFNNTRDKKKHMTKVLRNIRMKYKH